MAASRKPIHQAPTHTLLFGVRPNLKRRTRSSEVGSEPIRWPHANNITVAARRQSSLCEPKLESKYYVYMNTEWVSRRHSNTFSLHLRRGLSSDLLLSGFPSEISYAYYMPHPFHSRIDHPNNSWWIVGIMKPFIIHFSPACLSLHLP
jgi:hypothetical protein